MKRIAPVPLLALAVGAYWIWAGFGYGIWINNRLGSGFMPVFTGGLTVILSILVLLMKPGAGETTPRFDSRMLVMVGAVLLVMGLTWLTGLAAALAIFVFLWLYGYEKATLRLSLITAVGTASMLYLVFEYWLGVPFAKGLAGGFFR